MPQSIETTSSSWTAAPYRSESTAAEAEVASINDAISTTKDVLAWPPNDDVWVATSNTGAPEARRYHATAWTGNYLIVWGGEKPISQPIYTGGRYDPVLDVWVATSTVNVPHVPGYVAAWTGSRMCIWGVSGSSLVGALYDPNQNAWSGPLSTVGAPQGAFWEAFWTGSAVLLGGGCDVGGTRRPGGQYHPETDTWTSISMVNEPDSCLRHSAVWTGTEMIVWNSVTNVGARYAPATNTWTPMSTVGAPNWDEFSIAWAGGRVIVWGGLKNGVYLNTGRRYDPSTNTWAAVSTANAPSGRISHSAVGAGSLMIVWGGIEGGATPPTRTGGRYNPASDVWTRTTNLNAPEGRDLHPAVWTGSAMIIWGGNGWNGLLGSGASYGVFVDTDGDGVGDSTDCAPQTSIAWSVPGEATALHSPSAADKSTVEWTAPASPGGTMVLYDLLRAPVANLFSPSVCVATGIAATTSTDVQNPAIGTAFYYLVRAKNLCGGTLGRQSNGSVRDGSSCP